jgi:hypothetical protein
LFKIHVSVGGPKFLPQFLARDELTSALRQHHQNLDGLSLKRELKATLPQFSGTEVEFENTKSGKAAGLSRCFH